MGVRQGRVQTLIPSTTLAAATTVTGDDIGVPEGWRGLSVQAVFTRAGGGTTCDVFIQTSLDDGTTWVDIAQFAFTTTTATRIHGVRSAIALAANVTPTDGSLADNTILDGLMGDRVRCKYVTVGTYTGASSIKVQGVFQH